MAYKLRTTIWYYITAGKYLVTDGTSWDIEKFDYVQVKCTIPLKSCGPFTVSLFFLSAWFLRRVVKQWCAHARPASQIWNGLELPTGWITGSRRNRTNPDEVLRFLRRCIWDGKIVHFEVYRKRPRILPEINCELQQRRRRRSSRKGDRYHRQLPAAETGASIVPLTTKPLLPRLYIWSRAHVERIKSR
jgi:hypothetical protein